MAHFGLICPPGISHVTALTTIARELCDRGHQATMFNILDVEELARREGIGFRALGVRDHPRGAFKAFTQAFGRLHGLRAIRFGLRVARAEISMLLDEAPAAMREAGITALMVDQGQPAGSTLAAHLGVPFVTICNAVPLDPDPDVPPSVSSDGPARGVLDRWRNRLGYLTLDVGMRSLRIRINAARRAWGLAPLRSLYDTFSPLLEVTQQSEAFDFPRSKRPPQLHYVGLLSRTNTSTLPFPFERLDGRPLVYASVGTVATDTHGLFYMLADVTHRLNLQLVITLAGNRELADYVDLPGAPIVVHFAPQLEILRRASLTVCHAGNNTVLESLCFGVPVIAVPFNTDQNGVAARLVHSGAGLRLTLDTLSEAPLQVMVSRILGDPTFRERARAIGDSLARAGGAPRAADLIEACVGTAAAPAPAGA